MDIKYSAFRLWLCLSCSWTIFCAYELYSHYQASQSWFTAAKIQTEVRESKRDLIVQNEVFDSKDFHKEILEKGFISEPFDEAHAKEIAFSRAIDAQSKSKEYQEEKNSYKNAFSERKALSHYWLTLPSVPVILALLILCTTRIVRGFKEK